MVMAFDEQAIEHTKMSWSEMQPLLEPSLADLCKLTLHRLGFHLFSCSCVARCLILKRQDI